MTKYLSDKQQFLLGLGGGSMWLPCFHAAVHLALCISHRNYLHEVAALHFIFYYSNNKFFDQSSKNAIPKVAIV